MSKTIEKEIKFDAKDILANTRPTPYHDTKMSDADKIEKITGHFQAIMETLGMDLSNDSLQKSPHRVAKMYVNEIFAGLKEENFPRISVIENEMQYDQMIVIKDVNVVSFCEHHFVTIQGKANIAYIPNKRVIGLSKINRVAKYFSQRPQVQERLTKQIADCLSYVLDTPNVAVMIDAKHYCVISRGVEDVNSTTLTCDLRGEFREDEKTRQEFMMHTRVSER
ncbi:MAG: GTP cyclohydrolase I FolE [Bdellovibrionota bacterium]